MKRCLSARSLVLSAALALTASNLAAKTTVEAKNCEIIITINLEFHGPGADAAFATKVENEVENCWKGYKFKCCSVTVKVVTKVRAGNNPTTGFHQINVLDDAGTDVDDNVSSVNTPVPKPNGGSGSGTFSKSEPAETYAHEVGHLMGLGDKYKEKNEGGKRTTKPCAGHEKDKMATLAAGAKPQASAVNDVIKNAGVDCPESCWPKKTAGGKDRGCSSQTTPVPTPGPGQKRRATLTPSGANSTTVTLPLTLGGGSVEAAGFEGTVQLAVDGPPVPELNPNRPQDVATLQVLAMDLIGPSIELAPTLETGPNTLRLETSDPTLSSVGTLNLKTGEFELFVAGRLENTLFGPETTVLVESLVAGTYEFTSGEAVYDADSTLVPLGLKAPTRGYETQLTLDGPIQVGGDRTITGGGAPDAPGIYVELWRVAPGGDSAESVASVPATGGLFAFDGIDVKQGECYYATLSRSWQFNTDGEAEGWDTEVSPDATLEVSDGTLKITIGDGNGDGFRDAFFQNFFDYNPSFYRVVEVRLRNPVVPELNLLGLFWGAPWGETISEHNAAIPGGMEDFQSILIPMNLDEQDIVPGPPGLKDGLWDRGTLNNTLRVDPLNNLPPDDPDFDGTVFEIDCIRIREDYRWDFHDDTQGIDLASDIVDFGVFDGFLTYTVDDVGNLFQPGADGFFDPLFFSSYLTGRFDTGYFTTLGLGYDNLRVSNPIPDPDTGDLFTLVGLFFDDRDSVGFWDDGGPPGATVLQYAAALAPAVGRFDGFAPLDAITFDPVAGAPSPGEWSEDGGPSAQGLRFDFPDVAGPGDHAELDYLAILPAAPFGPSDPAQPVLPPNTPPSVVIAALPPVVNLLAGSAAVLLDGSGSGDPDGPQQPLTFLWEKVSGPSGDTIEFAIEPATQVRFTAEGDYTYSLTVSDGQETVAADITVTVLPELIRERFRRSDANADGLVDISDAIKTFGFLFLGDDAPPCLDAVDSNDDAAVDISDGVNTLNFLFSGGAPPPDPGPANCGDDPTPDALPECEYPQELCPI